MVLSQLRLRPSLRNPSNKSTSARLLAANQWSTCHHGVPICCNYWLSRSEAQTRTSRCGASAPHLHQRTLFSTLTRPPPALHRPHLPLGNQHQRSGLHGLSPRHDRSEVLLLIFIMPALDTVNGTRVDLMRLSPGSGISPRICLVVPWHMPIQSQLSAPLLISRLLRALCAFSISTWPAPGAPSEPGWRPVGSNTPRCRARQSPRRT
jgi:hypothetical protein